MTAFISSPECIGDPHLIEIGANTIIGQDSILSGHFQPNSLTTRLGKIKIGSDVLIGAGCKITPGVTIGNHSIVQANSIVYPGTQIPPNEIWGGSPAQKLKDIKNKTAKPTSESDSTTLRKID